MDYRQSAPRSTGEILDVTFRVYRATFSQWWPWGLAFAALAVVSGLLQPAAASGFGVTAPPSEVFAAFMNPTFLMSMTFVICASVWGYGAMIYALNGVYVGSPVSLGAAASRGGRLFLPFLGLGILTTLFIAIGFVALVIPGVLVLGRLVVANTALVIEQQGVFAALSRSWSLTKGHWWRASTVLFVGALIVGVAAAILVGILVAVIVLLFRSDPALVRLLTVLLQAVSPFFTAAFIPTLTIVLYYDLKTRADGDDLERRAEALGPA